MGTDCSSLKSQTAAGAELKTPATSFRALETSRTTPPSDVYLYGANYNKYRLIKTNTEDIRVYTSMVKFYTTP